mgnify:CR=1 FL=1
MYIIILRSIKCQIKTYQQRNIYCLVIISTLTLGMNKSEEDVDGKIFTNIYIQNVDVGSMTIKQAKDKISLFYSTKPINIKYCEKIWSIDPESIRLKYNIDESINMAYKYTRSSDTKQNIKRMFNLKFKEKHNINITSTYDEVELSNILDRICKEINVKVKQASIEIKDSGEIVKSNSSDGKEVDIIKLKEDIYEIINSKKIKDINLVVKTIKPTIKTEDIDSINTILGQYSTSFNDHTSRGSNIHVAGKSTSDILIMPGENFSYNKATGARTWSNGYKTAKVIVGGKYVNGEGGGVCQVSTTIYNAALISGMEIEEVHNHTFPSRYAPRGKDAAVSYGYTDLKFKNPFSHPIYIKNIVNHGAITSKIYGCSQDREKLYIKTEERHEKDKIKVKTYRIYLDEENNKIREELISESKYKKH